MSYIPHSQNDIDSMLSKLGVDKVEDLFRQIPDTLRAKSFALPRGISEQDVLDRLSRLARNNKAIGVSFLGAGYYDHYVPSAVDSISSLPEFYTAYTPYQPEASQGWLQSIFEYQSAMCELTGMDVSNASMYDGTTALAEAVLMAIRHTRKNKIIVCGNINFLYKNVLKTYANAIEFDVVESGISFAACNKDNLTKMLDVDTAAIVVQNPDFFGRVSDYTDLVSFAHSKGILVIMVTYPISLGIIKTPGEMGADIVVAEGQCLGNYLAFGGPYLGILCASKKYARKLPGRIVGKTTDLDGKPGFVLTLQAREQHIRREKAASNICSNQALCALRSLIYLSLLGSAGLKQLSRVIFDRADYLRQSLSEISSITVEQYDIFNEFVVDLSCDAEVVVEKICSKGTVVGLPLGLIDHSLKNKLLISVTEKNSVEDIDKLVELIKEIV